MKIKRQSPTVCVKPLSWAGCASLDSRFRIHSGQRARGGNYGSSIRYNSRAAPDASDGHHHIDAAPLAELTGSEMLTIRQVEKFECWANMLASRRHLGDLHAVYGNRDFEMSFKPTVDQLCTIADMTVGRMTQDFIASRIGVSIDEFSAWRLKMMAATVAEETSPPPPLPPPRARQAPMTADRLFEAHEPEKA